MLKHRAMPKIRQAIPLMVLPVVVCTSLAVLNSAALIPAGSLGSGLYRLRCMAGRQSAQSLWSARRLFRDGDASGVVDGILAAGSRSANTQGVGTMSPASKNAAPDLRIDVCVCTYRRRELEDTLRSIGALTVPPNADDTGHCRRQRCRAYRA